MLNILSLVYPEMTVFISGAVGVENNMQWEDAIEIDWENGENMDWEN